MDYYSQIPAFVEGTLNEKERVAFEAELERDEDLRNAVEHYPLIRESLEAASQEDARLLVHRIRKSMVQEDTSKSKIFLFSYRWAVAASILLLLIAGALIFSNVQYTTRAIVEAAWEQPPELGTFQSDDRKHEQWENIMTDWNTEKKDEALRKAGDLLQQHPQDAELKQRVAHLYYQSGNSSGSAQLLAQIRDDRRYGDYADFHLALALIHSGQMEDAIGILDSIISNSDHRFNQEAKQVKKDVESIWHKLVL